jgi:hypothetical protein
VVLSFHRGDYTVSFLQQSWDATPSTFEEPFWNVYSLWENDTWEVGTYQDDDGDGIRNELDQDIDGDGVLNDHEAPCGTTAPPGYTPKIHPYRYPERLDGPFTRIDDDGDGLSDEPLPFGAANYDCDGDGYLGAVEAHVFASSSGDTSRNQIACGTSAWPADFVSGGLPGSTNRVTLQDLTSFLGPIRHLNTNVGDNPGNIRWDLAPGKGPFTKDINVQDLTSLLAVSPPMLQGVRAFNGPVCPWPP